MRGNSCYYVTITSGKVFQFTPLHERQPFHQYIQQQQVIFQFTPLHERQLLSQAWQLPLQEELFQFTPLHERQQTEARRKWTKKAFQFTPLHERQRLKTYQDLVSVPISIHAST